MSPSRRLAGIALSLLAGAAATGGAEPAPAQAQQGAARPAMSAWCRAFVQGYTSQPMVPQDAEEPPPPAPLLPAMDTETRGVAAPAPARTHLLPVCWVPFTRGHCARPPQRLGSGLQVGSPLAFHSSALPGTGLHTYPSIPWVAPGMRTYWDRVITAPSSAPHCPRCGCPPAGKPEHGGKPWPAPGHAGCERQTSDLR